MKISHKKYLSDRKISKSEDYSCLGDKQKLSKT